MCKFQGGIIMQMKDVQREILENKRRHGFNTTNIELEICYLYGEIRESYEAYYKGLDTFGEELADVAIFLMGIAEIKKIDLATEVLRKTLSNHYDSLQGGIAMEMQDMETGITVHMRDVQREIHENEVRHGFNITNVEQKFCNLYGEVGEAYEAYYKGWDTFAEELADVAIYLMGIAEIKGIDLGAEILKKVEKNKNRQYERNEKGYMVHL